MTTGLVQDRTLEKQMKKQIGCMSGFLQIFDRQQLRIYSTKRLPPAMESSSESEQASPSPAVSKEFSKEQRIRSEPSPDRSIKQSPTNGIRSPAESPAKSHLPISALEFKEGSRSSWKFSREAPRLSLDSRSTVDAKGGLRQIEARTNTAILFADGAENRGDGYGVENDNHRRSTSVVARLMGLEPLAPPIPSPAEKSELRRSASESRVSRDLYRSRLVDGDNFSQNREIESRFATKLKNSKKTNVKPEPAKSQSRGFGSRKIFFDSQDVFPDPKPSVSIYGEIERRLRLRGIDEPSKDLETLKQILDALQLKGLLHSRQASSNHHSNQRKSTVMVPPNPSPRSRPVDRRSPIPAVETATCRRSQSVDRSPRSPARNETGVKSPLRRKPLTVEPPRKINDSSEQRRASLSPTSSPKVSTRRTVSDRPIGNRSPKNRKPTAKILREEDEYLYSSISETETETETELQRSKDGGTLLERCDKLLLSIAEIATTELQPSPVSVLDSSFYEEGSSFRKDESSVQRSIEFKEEVPGIDYENWSPENNSDSDFVYISEIFRTSSYSSEGSDQFLVLEKQQRLNGKSTSKASRIQRKLIFDTVGEILQRQRLSPPWEAFSGEKAQLERTWLEFQRIRERDTCEDDDLFEVICGILRKDLAGDAISGWGYFSIETSEAVLDIERLVFKDLVGELIRDLAVLAVDRNSGPRRKLVF